MIVNQIKKGWEIIFHPAHGLLAAQLGHYLEPSMFFEDYRIETLAAIQHHDDHQSDFGDKNYITAIGAPQDFTLAQSNISEKCKQIERVTSSGYKKSLWVGLLVSYHCDFLYSGNVKSKRIKRLLDNLKKERKAIFKKAEFGNKDLEKEYDLMRFCDRLSLMLTRNNIPEMGRRVEIITFSKGTKYELWADKEGQLSVAPWPFKENKFSVKIDLRILEKLKFKSDQQLLKSIEQSPISHKRWNFVKKKT